MASRSLATSVFFVACGLTSIGGWGCGGSCPTARYAEERKHWADAIRAAQPVALNPSASISIKRDVHNLIVGVDASTFAKSFHAVMRDPERRFGLIRLDRLPENAGQPFHLGERIQGRYELSAAGRQQLSGIWKGIFGPALDNPFVEEQLCKIENSHTSDYVEIIELSLDTPVNGKFTMTYRYLQPTPIAGTSTFEVADVVDPDELKGLGVQKAALVRQIFVYQEQNTGFADFFTTGGLRLHDQVVNSQVTQSAEAAGTCVLRSDIPAEYAAEL
jgi:hypothetical protein